MYAVKFTKQAAKDARKLKAAGLDKKAKALVEVLKRDRSTSCLLPAPKLNWFSSLDVPISSRSFSATAFSTIATPLALRGPVGCPPQSALPSGVAIE